MYFHGIPRLSHARHNTSHSDLFEKSELRGRALEAWFRLPRKVIANDLRMHISLGIFINLILKELLLQSIAVIVLAKKKQKTASGFSPRFKSVDREKSSILTSEGGCESRARATSRTSMDAGNSRKRFSNHVFGNAFVPVLVFKFTSCWNIRMKGLMNHLQNKKVMRGFLHHLNVHVQSQARVLKPWLKASHKRMMSMALRKSGDLCRLCGKSQQDVGLSSETISCCHVPFTFPRTRAESSAGDEGLRPFVFFR